MARVSLVAVDPARSRTARRSRGDHDPNRAMEKGERTDARASLPQPGWALAPPAPLARRRAVRRVVPPPGGAAPNACGTIRDTTEDTQYGEVPWNSTTAPLHEKWRFRGRVGSSAEVTPPAPPRPHHPQQAQ